MQRDWQIVESKLIVLFQIVPYLICMSTDEDKSISSCADKQLQDIEKKYPGFIHMKAQTGIKLSFKLQKIIQGMHVARGFRVKESELPSALNGFLYSILRSKQQRRALVLSILKQFEEQVVCIAALTKGLCAVAASQPNPLWLSHYSLLGRYMTEPTWSLHFQEFYLEPFAAIISTQSET